MVVVGGVTLAGADETGRVYVGIHKVLGKEIKVDRQIKEF